MIEEIWTVQDKRSGEVVGVFQDLDDAFDYGQWHRDKHGTTMEVQSHAVCEKGWFKNSSLSKSVTKEQT